MIPLSPAELDLVIAAIRGGETVGGGGVGYSTDYRFDPEPPPEGRWMRTDTDGGDSAETVVSETEVRGYVTGVPLCARELVLAPHWSAHRAAVVAGDTSAALAALAGVPAHDTLRVSAQVAAIHAWPAPADAEVLRLLRANAAGGNMVSILRRSLGAPELAGAATIIEAWLTTLEEMLGEALPRERDSLKWYR
ncbi:hypothetical protein LBMAG42_40190 [Deltaproteobacteria bacterium]|nr:hypothetical protein LBMAG42_40190 [Deltaproteobacteria bacterium]